MLKDSSNGVLLAVKVVPKSSKNEIIGWENDFLKIRLKAVPEKGEANEALIAFLAKVLSFPKSKIIITHGETSRQKRLCFLEGSKEDLEIKLQALLAE